jgi:hypothetical protein
VNFDGIRSLEKACEILREVLKFTKTLYKESLTPAGYSGRTFSRAQPVRRLPQRSGAGRIWSAKENLKKL